MKYFFLISCLFILLFSCKKEVRQLPDFSNNLLDKLKLSLKDSISADDLQQLDFYHSYISKTDKSNFSIVRIPFKNKSIETDFLLLELGPELTISNGRFIHIDREGILKKSINNFNGNILIESLERKMLISSNIVNGYIVALHQQNNSQNARYIIELLPDMLPEVIMVSNYPPRGGLPMSTTLYYLQSFFGQSTSGGSDSGTSGGGVSGSYSDSDPTSYNYSGSGGGASPNPNPVPIENTKIDFEDLRYMEAIDLKQYLNCFSKIADAGASYTMKLLVDIPVDEDPTAYFNWSTGSPGHSFIQIVKKNGTQSIQQNIGFYPATRWKTVTTLPVAGKFVDNGQHEFNASIKMDLTADNFKSTLSYILYLSTFIKYDIDDNNCTNFALDVFNYKRGSDPLIIEKQNIPGGLSQNGSSTPQAIYRRLEQMKGMSSAISDNISLPGIKSYAVKSSGPCN